MSASSFRLVAGHVVLPSSLGTPRYFVYLPFFSYYPIWDVYNFSPSPPSWGPSTPTVKPGYGLMIKTGPTNMTFSLPDPPSPVLPLQLPAGFSLVCCQSNVAATYDMIVGRSPVEGAKIYKLHQFLFNTDLDETNYYVYVFTNGSWTPEVPVADIGEAVWVFEPPAVSNPQITSDQFNFDALTPWGGSVDVEYSDSLSGPWLVLTNLSGFGGVTNVSDPSSTGDQLQRFYRLNMLQN
jgi:hypothetical protein